MANPVSDMVKKLSEKYKKNNPDTNLGGELAERARMNQAALGTPKPEVDAPRTGTTPANSQAPYGTQGAERKLDTSYLDKPTAIKTYDKGGKVNVHDGKHQLAILKDGERVLTEKQNKKYEKGEKPDKENPAEDALEMKVYDNGGKVATPFDMISGPKKAPKTIQKHEYSRTHNGRHVVTHKHHDPSHKDETHMFEKFSDAADHMNANPPQPEPAEAGAPPAAPAAPAPGAGAPPAAQ